MLDLMKDLEAFAKEIGADIHDLWAEFKAFVRNKHVEEPPKETSSTTETPGV